MKRTLALPPSVPVQGPNGLMNTSRISRGSVMRVYEAIGGDERLAQVADENPMWFYEKGFFKMMAPERDPVADQRSIADILREIDREREANTINITPEREKQGENE